MADQVDPLGLLLRRVEQIRSSEGLSTDADVYRLWERELRHRGGQLTAGTIAQVLKGAAGSPETVGQVIDVSGLSSALMDLERSVRSVQEASDEARLYQSVDLLMSSGADLRALADGLRKVARFADVGRDTVSEMFNQSELEQLSHSLLVALSGGEDHRQVVIEADAALEAAQETRPKDHALRAVNALILALSCHEENARDARVAGWYGLATRSALRAGLVDLRDIAELHRVIYTRKFLGSPPNSARVRECRRSLQEIANRTSSRLIKAGALAEEAKLCLASPPDRGEAEALAWQGFALVGEDQTDASFPFWMGDYLTQHVIYAVMLCLQLSYSSDDALLSSQLASASQMNRTAGFELVTFPVLPLLVTARTRLRSSKDDVFIEGLRDAAQALELSSQRGFRYQLKKHRDVLTPHRDKLPKYLSIRCNCGNENAQLYGALNPGYLRYLCTECESILIPVGVGSVRDHGRLAANLGRRPTRRSARS